MVVSTTPADALLNLPVRMAIERTAAAPAEKEPAR